MEYIAVGLATYYLTNVVLYENGLFNIFYKLRQRFDTKLFTCFKCMSFWVALLLTALYANTLQELAIGTLASAGIAIFLYEAI